MNAEKLNEIKERAEKATSGPWKIFKNEDGTLIGTAYAHPQLKDAVPVVGIAIQGKEPHRIIYMDRVDAEFISHAREDVPKLVAEVERLNDEMADREQSHITLYNDNQRLLDALKSACNSLGADISDYYNEGER